MRIELSKSFEIAVVPVTPTSTPSTAPIVAGMMSSRSEASAAFEAASVPVPSIGRSISATVRAAFMSTVIGWWTCPVASACFCSSAIADLTSGASTDGALTTTIAGSCSPGKAAWSRL